MIRSGFQSEDFVSPYPDNCTGYGGSGGYVLGLTLAVGIQRSSLGHEGSRLLDEILAYDQAEVEDTYLGQINMIQVSSFCGPEGRIWGYDLASNIENCAPIGGLPAMNGHDLRSASGLRSATRALLGGRSDRRYPVLPGSHVPCASKYRFVEGPGTAYAGVAIGIPRSRGEEACLLMEDVGHIPESVGNDLATWEEMQVSRMAESVRAVGRNQLVAYPLIFADVVTRRVNEGEIACPLVAAPYMKLAREACVPGLEKMTLREWDSAVGRLEPVGISD